MKKKTILFKPNHIRASFSGDMRVLDLASENNVRINQPCGGNGTCGKCRIKIKDASTVPTDRERLLLTQNELKTNIRLACQTLAEDGMIIYTRNQRADILKMLGFSTKIDKGNLLPEVCMENLEKQFDTTAAGGVYGIALDIGTTTLAASLVNLDTGETVANTDASNPQSAYGDDVISRISFAVQSPENVARLQAVVIAAVNKMIAELLEKARVEKERVFHLIAGGNTTMEHLFMGEDVASIGAYPFTPKFYKFPRKRAADLSLTIRPDAYVDLMPNISGFVGGDITAGIYYTDIANKNISSFLIDLGTNSEMVFASKNNISVCSAAAGPALEGARIRCGMRAERGAIDKVRIAPNGTIEINTIGGPPPCGFCGSGLVDLIAELRRTGIITANGAFANNGAGAAWRSLRTRISQREYGKEIYIADGENGSIVLTQRDIREVQLAKSAIASGLEMLLEAHALPLSKVDRLYLAGAFGNYLDNRSTLELGILPEIDEVKITIAGNTAGLGCVKALLSRTCWEEIGAFLARTTHIELATSPNFQQRFVANMQFR